MKETTEQRIDRYLNQELSEAERTDFEQELEQNPEFKAECIATKRIVDALRMQEDEKACEAIRALSIDQIKEAIATDQPHVAPKRRLGRLIATLAVAASLLLFWFRPYQYNTQELLSPDMIPASLELTVARGGDDPFGESNNSITTVEMINTIVLNFYSEGHLDSIQTLYNDHSKAQLWQQLPSETQSVIAFSLIRFDRYDQAASLLLYLETAQISSQTAWLKLIVLLRLEHRALARSVAQELIKRDDGYKEKAQKVLEKINKRIIFH